MLMKQILEIYDILDSIYANGAAMEEYLRVIDPDADIDVYASVFSGVLGGSAQDLKE